MSGVYLRRFHLIFQYFQCSPSSYCFASSQYAICENYFSKIPQTGSHRTDFFLQKLVDTEKYFCCPTTNLIIHCFKYIISHEKISELLIIPVWTSANCVWFCVLLLIFIQISRNIFFWRIFSLFSGNQNRWKWQLCSSRLNYVNYVKKKFLFLDTLRSNKW